MKFSKSPALGTQRTCTKATNPVGIFSRWGDTGSAESIPAELDRPRILSHAERRGRKTWAREWLRMELDPLRPLAIGNYCQHFPFFAVIRDAS